MSTSLVATGYWTDVLPATSRRRDQTAASAQPLPQLRRCEIEEGSQLGGEAPLLNVDQADRRGLGFELPEHDDQFAGCDRVGDLIREHTSQSDSRNGAFDCAFGGIHRESRVHTDRRARAKFPRVGLANTR